MLKQIGRQSRHQFPDVLILAGGLQEYRSALRHEVPAITHHSVRVAAAMAHKFGHGHRTITSRTLHETIRFDVVRKFDYPTAYWHGLSMPRKQVVQMESRLCCFCLYWMPLHWLVVGWIRECLAWWYLLPSPRRSDWRSGRSRGHDVWYRTELYTYYQMTHNFLQLHHFS
jgi:hypothetical protein